MFTDFDRYFCFLLQTNCLRKSSDVERLQEVKTSAMEESTDTEATSHPVVHRATVTGHHGGHNGHVQVVGAARRVQHRHKIRTLSDIGATVNTGLQTRVSRLVYFLVVLMGGGGVPNW